MTDKEIIKALECLCGGGDSCIECAYHKRYRFGECKRQVAKNALDLITRQQAEIERLKECPKCVYEYDGEITEYCVQGPCPNFKTVEQIKSEAVKEFAERLKHSFFDNGYESPDVDFDYFVNNLTKEMVGEDNA